MKMRVTSPLVALFCAFVLFATSLGKTVEKANEQSTVEAKEKKEASASSGDEVTSDAVDGETEELPHAIPDHCAKLDCGEGEECVIEEGKDPFCQCIKSCPLESNFRNNVCSNANVTYNSECEFHRQECLCREDQVGCLDKGVLDTHLDYFGACVAIRECSKEELINFPSRMAQWLKSVMESLDIRQELSVHYSELHRRSRRSSNPLIVPAIWEFCNIDTSHDRIISRTEFFPLIAPLKALEHCIGDFLDSADQDSNGEITLKEWGEALNIKDDEIEDICEKVPESS